MTIIFNNNGPEANWYFSSMLCPGDTGIIIDIGNTSASKNHLRKPVIKSTNGCLVSLIDGDVLFGEYKIRKCDFEMKVV